MRTGKRIAIALAAVVLTSVVLVLAFAIPAHQEPRFIREMGTMIREEYLLARHVPIGTMAHTYKFGVDFDSVVLSMRRDLKSPKWVWTRSTLIVNGDAWWSEKDKSWKGGGRKLEGWSVTHGPDKFSIYDNVRSSTGFVEVEWRRAPRKTSWIENQWSVVKSWFGR